MDVKAPKLAQKLLEDEARANSDWLKWAQQGQIVDEVPPEPSLTKGNIVFSAEGHSDINPIQMFGTPATRANAIVPAAGDVAMELNLTEVRYNQAVLAREGRNTKALAGVGDNEIANAIRAREGMSLPDAMAAPEAELNANSKRIVQYIYDKMNVDKEIVIPRLRDNMMDMMRRRVRADFEEASPGWGKKIDQATVDAAASHMTREAIPDDWGPEKLYRIWPMDATVKDAKGNVLGHTSGWDNTADFIRDQAKKLDMKASDFNIESKATFDSDMMPFFKGRVERTITALGDSLQFSKADIQAAIEGKFNTDKKLPFFSSLQERAGKGGFGTDLKTMLNAYDRGIEKWLMLSDAEDKVRPILNELTEKNYTKLASDLRMGLKALWGYRMPGSIQVDNMIQAIPLLNKVVGPGALERVVSGSKTGMVNAFIKYSAKTQAVNATQILTTLWPIADAKEIWQGAKLMYNDVGKAILERHLPSGSKIEGMASSIGPIEKFNQNLAFMTMYNRARKLGFSDARAADYGILRGNLYSQFLGLTTDQPIAFQKLATKTGPLAMATMFQRFPVKQVEQMIDLIKDQNFPGAAKWLGTNLALGGFKAATFGGAGWLGYKTYKMIEEKYGKTTADLFHTGLPSLAGVDVSNSIAIYNPPFGANLAEKIGNFALGPVGSVGTSVIGAAISTSAPEPEAGKRMYDAIVSRVPMAKELDALSRIFSGDYDFNDPQGRMKYKGDVVDVVKRMGAFTTSGGVMGETEGPYQMKETELNAFAGALLEMESKRNEVINFAASRYGQARIAGIDLGKDMQEMVEKEVNDWNNLYPEFPITGSELVTRSKAKADAATKTMGQRLLQGAPRVFRQSGTFQPSQSSIPPGGG